MKKIMLMMVAIYTMPVLADNIIINGSRFIYPQSEKEITVKLTNTTTRPALAQVWLDNGDPSVAPDKISTPFVIMPPISRIDGNGGQSVRVRLSTTAGLPTDKESLWWLNVLDIPSMVKKAASNSGGELQMAIRSRLKFIYRPTGLTGREHAIEKLVLKASGKELTVSNPTPFYITVAAIVPDKQKALNDKAVMIAPQSMEKVALREAIYAGEEFSVVEINDYGGVTKSTLKAL